MWFELAGIWKAEKWFYNALAWAHHHHRASKGWESVRRFRPAESTGAIIGHKPQRDECRESMRWLKGRRRPTHKTSKLTRGKKCRTFRFHLIIKLEWPKVLRSNWGHTLFWGIDSCCIWLMSDTMSKAITLDCFSFWGNCTEFAYFN